MLKKQKKKHWPVFRIKEFVLNIDGNLSIMLGEKRTASVRTIEFCETFVLYSEDFFRIKKEYPEFMEVMKKMSSEKTEQAIQLLLEVIVL